ncbi:MAG: pyridoxamine 5'-phosphate oxidase family protein [Candidatus Brocadiia bacterium]
MEMNLKDKALALEVLRSLEVIHMATVDAKGHAAVRAMSIAHVDDDLTVWFGTFDDSAKIADIRANGSVSLSAWEKGHSFRSWGDATVVTDQEMKTKLWQQGWKRFFRKGDTDPNYVLARVTVKDFEVYKMPQG